MSNEYKPFGQKKVNQYQPVENQRQVLTQTMQPTNISVLTPEAIKYKILMYVMMAVLLIALAGGGAALFYMWTHPTVQYEKQVDVENPQTEKKLAAQAGTNISDFQANEASQTMHDEYVGKIPPTKVIETTGKDYQNVVKQESKNSGADQTLVVDKNNPNKKPDPKPTDKVELNVYNNKFFPDKQVGVTLYNDSSIAIDYNKRVKMFGTTVYIGPSIMYDNKDKDFKYGVRASIPL
jgi:hypothetical protein